MKRLVATAAAALILLDAAVMISASQNAFPVIPSIRRAPEARPASPPPLFAAADRVAPLTLDVRLQRQGAGRTETWHQTIHRTADRIHVAGTGGREWVFERNVRDARRVSGALIDHDSRTIVVYEESDLRNAFGIAGWANVLGLGIDPSWFASLAPTDEKRIVKGIPAVRYTPVDRHVNTGEVWWAADEALPVAFKVADGSAITRLSIERVKAGVDAMLLQFPASRFPHYAVVQFADWLERH
jgi:hypothetical protein